MGGFGAGRRGWRATVEGTEALIFDIRALTRRGLKPGILARAALVWSDTWTGQDFTLGVVVDTTDMGCPFVELAHNCRADQPEAIRYRARLLTTSPNYGGLRWWFACPGTGQRITKLCLPLGGWQFWSRRAYDLAYQSQREQKHDRALRALQSIRAGLGGPEYVNLALPFPTRPKGMWSRTYERLAERAATAEAVADERAWAIAARLRTRNETRCA